MHIHSTIMIWHKMSNNFVIFIKIEKLLK